MLRYHSVVYKSKKIEATFSAVKVKSESHSVESDSVQPHGLYSPWNSGRLLEWVAFLFSRGSSQPRDWIQVCALQADSLPAELHGYAPLAVKVGYPGGVGCGAVPTDITEAWHVFPEFNSGRIYTPLLASSLMSFRKWVWLYNYHHLVLGDRGPAYF